MPCEGKQWCLPGLVLYSCAVQQPLIQHLGITGETLQVYLDLLEVPPPLFIPTLNLIILPLTPLV